MNTPSTTGEHYTRLSPSEKWHKHPCGCFLRRDDVGAVSLYQCPTHDAAPQLRSLVVELAELIETFYGGKESAMDAGERKALKTAYSLLDKIDRA